jgi:hypothetical protein
MKFNIGGRVYTVKFVHSTYAPKVGEDRKEITTCQLREYRYGESQPPDFVDNFGAVGRFWLDMPSEVTAHKKSLARAMKNAGYGKELREKLWTAYFSRRKHNSRYE